MDRALWKSQHPSKRSALICLAISLWVYLPNWGPNARAAAASNCVLKLKFSSDDRTDSGTNTFVRQILSGEGYTVVDDWLFTIWSHSDYEVKLIISHTDVPNYGFPVNLTGMQLSIADSAGDVLLDSFIDRANLEANLRAFIPACVASPPPDSKADIGRDVDAQ